MTKAHFFLFAILLSTFFSCEKDQDVLFTDGAFDPLIESDLQRPPLIEIDTLDEVSHKEEELTNTEAPPNAQNESGFSDLLQTNGIGNTNPYSVMGLDSIPDLPIFGNDKPKLKGVVKL